MIRFFFSLFFATVVIPVELVCSTGLGMKSHKRADEMEAQRPKDSRRTGVHAISDRRSALVMHH